MIDESGSPRLLKVASAIGAVGAVILLARLTVFMADPTKVGYSTLPSSQWEVEHSCLSAYHIAANAAGTMNVYESSLYTASTDTGIGLRQAKRLGPFKVDVFEYPPQFLLLPRALHVVTPDFMDLRLLWFGFSVAMLLTASVVVARYMGGAVGTRVLLLSPLLWISPTTTLSTLQKGNVQIVIIAAALMAMVLIMRGHRALGGAMLAFATVSKLWPGILIVYLLARRDWRAVGWVAAFGAAFSAITFAMFGWSAYAAFLDHAPRLMSGEAFPAFRNPAAMVINLSIPNILFKLNIFGVPGATFEVAKVLGSIYTIIMIVITVWAARRPWRPVDQPLVWLGILILATLRSPFLPMTYGAIPAIWLLTLVGAGRVPTGRWLTLVGVAWIGLNLAWPIDWSVDPRIGAGVSFVPLILTVAIAARVLRREAVATAFDASTTRANSLSVS